MQRPGEVVAGSPTQTAVWRLPCPPPPGTGAAGPGERRGPGQQKLDRDPWLKRIFAGYAFALEIEAYYDAEDVSDWVHAETGNKVLKAQHPELEVWSQGVPARAGVACADRHMPYQRAGALKVSDHWVQPAPQYQPRGQICHGVSEQEGQGRVLTIQDRHHALLQRAAKATTGAGPRRGHRLRAPGAARGGPRRARAQVAATLTAPLPLERRASHFGTLSPPRGEGRGRGEWLLLSPSIRREQRPGEPGADPGRLD